MEDFFVEKFLGEDEGEEVEEVQEVGDEMLEEEFEQEAILALLKRSPRTKAS